MYMSYSENYIFSAEYGRGTTTKIILNVGNNKIRSNF